MLYSDVYRGLVHSWWCFIFNLKVMKRGTPKMMQFEPHGAWGLGHGGLIQAGLRRGLHAEWTDARRVKGSGVEKRVQGSGIAPGLVPCALLPRGASQCPSLLQLQTLAGVSFRLWRPNTWLTLRTNLETNTLQFYKPAAGWGGLLPLHHCTPRVLP